MSYKLTKAYILKRKPYRESSYLLEVFTLDFGIVSLVFRGAKNLKKPVKSQIVNPFNLVNVNFNTQKKSLSALRKYEIIEQYLLEKTWLYCGFYLNEILLKLFASYDPNPKIFQDYHFIIRELSYCPNFAKTQWLLRYFEIKLLREIGFGLDFYYDSAREIINNKQNYYFDLNKGFIKKDSNQAGLIKGEVLIVLNQLLKQKVNQLDENGLDPYLPYALKLMRFIINHALNGKTIESRKILSEYLNL